MCFVSLFWTCVWLISKLFLNLRTLNPQNATSHFGKTNSCLKSPFRKQIEKCMICGSLLAPFCYHSPSLFGIIFGIRFWMPLLMNFDRKIIRKTKLSKVVFALLWRPLLHRKSYPGKNLLMDDIKTLLRSFRFHFGNICHRLRCQFRNCSLVRLFRRFQKLHPFGGRTLRI